MLFADRRKSEVLIGGSIILCVIAGLYFLLTQQIHADDPSRLATIPQTAFPSDVDGEPVLGVFEGITPCSNENPPIPQIAENLVCEQMIWKLTLYQDVASGDPTTYQLSSAYGLSQQGSTGLQRGGTLKDMEGQWTIVEGMQTNPKAVVYQLNPVEPDGAINFVKLDDNILHLLNPDMTLMVGNAAWSYTLNRTDKSIDSDATDLTALSTPVPITSEVSDAGIFKFEGRIPCDEMIMVLHSISASGCQRVKMGLTLQESTFELNSIYVGTGDTRYTTTGTWAMLQDTRTDPERLVYQLQPDEAQRPLYFLKADDNHMFLLDADLNFMVGDALLSFTLSRKVE